MPQAVVVEVDGGRLRTRASGQGPGVHQVENKENKIACLATLDSVTHAEDPQPEPPPAFVQPRRVQRLVQQMASLAGESPTKEDAAGPAAPDAAEVEPPAGGIDNEPWAPKRRLRTCVASMAASHAFAPMMAAEAQARDFYAAARRAFVADGLAYNWSIQQGYFPDFEPIVDFLHVVCYLYQAAWGLGHDEASRWSLYHGWVRLCWHGQVSTVK
jgi:hypothetical protein